MLTLGISTSSGQFTIVLGDDNKLLFNSDDLQLSDKKDINILISKCFELTNRKAIDISNIIVDIGPGGTSRVRTGIAFANSLAYSLAIPVCPVSSLELAGIDIWQTKKIPVISTVNSINGNAYIGYYNENKLISINYGTIDKIVPSIVNGTNEIAIVGYHRSQIKQLLSNAHTHIIDTGKFYGSARFLVENFKLFLERGLFYPKFAIPITEKIFQR